MIAVGKEFHIVITDRYRKDHCPAADLYPGISNLFLFLKYFNSSSPSDKAGTDIKVLVP